MLGGAIHQSTNVNHDPFFQRTTVNHFYFHKVNFQGPYLVHNKLRKWFLFHKWRAWLGINSTSSSSYSKKNICRWRRDKLVKEETQHCSRSLQGETSFQTEGSHYRCSWSHRYDWKSYIVAIETIA